MYSFNTGFSWIVNHCIGNATRFQYFQSLICLAAQIFKLSKLYGLRWARLSACWLQSCALPIRAESTLERASISFILFHHAKGTTNNAISAAIAYIRLNEHRPKFHAYDCASGTRFQAAGHFAMLADVRRKAPRRQLLCGIAATP